MKRQMKGSALLGPLPAVLVSCAAGEEKNVFTAAWTGMINTRPPKTYVSIRPSRYSYRLIRESGVFVLNLTTQALVSAADFCGTYTGAKVDKFARCALTPEPATVVSCPMIAESPVSLECRVTDVMPLGSHDLFLADVVAVQVDESLFDRNGRILMERAEPVAFLHGGYYALGECLGTIGCGIVKKKREQGFASGSARRGQRKT